MSPEFQKQGGSRRHATGPAPSCPGRPCSHISPLRQHQSCPDARNVSPQAGLHLRTRFSESLVFPRIPATRELLGLDELHIKFSNGNTQTYSDLSGTSGTFSGSSSNNNKQIKQVWVESGSNANLSAEGWGEKFNFYNQDIANWLSLASYPHPSGSSGPAHT